MLIGLILFGLGVAAGWVLRPAWRALRFWAWQGTTYVPTGIEPPPGYDEWYFPDGHKR